MNQLELAKHYVDMKTYAEYLEIKVATFQRALQAIADEQHETHSVDIAQAALKEYRV